MMPRKYERAAGSRWESVDKYQPTIRGDVFAITPTIMSGVNVVTMVPGGLEGVGGLWLQGRADPIMVRQGAEPPAAPPRS